MTMPEEEAEKGYERSSRRGRPLEMTQQKDDRQASGLAEDTESTQGGATLWRRRRGARQTAEPRLFE